MKYDYWRFAGVLLLSFLIGIVTGYPSLCIIAGLLIFIWWQYKEFSKILTWLQRRKESDSPSQTGIVDEISREIDYLRRRHNTRKQKLSGYLKRFQDATGALPDAVIVLGPQNEIEWANEKALEYIGVKWPGDAGLRLSNLVRNPKLKKYLDANKKELIDGLQIPSPVNADLILEFRVSAYGEENQKLLVARDITVILRINHMRKDFVANASHELRTPLTVISGYLEGFVDDEDCPKGWKGYLHQMRIQASRMQRLIEDLMQLSGLEAGVSRAEKQVVQVPEMLMSIANEARSLSGFMSHDVSLDVDQNLYLTANHQEIYSIFSNLVFNAVQYTPEKGQIDIHWYQDDEGAHFSVKDNGLGIAPEHIPRLTERFYRIDKGRSREKGGTGLGLAIVKHALARHDGVLNINSDLGKGSCFRCDFPKSSIMHSDYIPNRSLSA